ncbi:MAG: hypothetical protein JRI53_05190 [Deltaproteobacteria bacterium]|nr:hypothetical protein [Deltaproteobacteria bacterium]MBW1984092.1 hypothetical protein [Deltaproteobacteria bacterium]MBW2180287.1 hypothetical protein [Deltaproteobacteria bacterium]
MNDKLKIGLKYCGGCNPTYDRGLMAEKITRELDGKANFVTIIEDDVDMVLSIQGCDVSCADLKPLKDFNVRIVNSIDDAEAFINEIQKTANSDK